MGGVRRYPLGATVRAGIEGCVGEICLLAQRQCHIREQRETSCQVGMLELLEDQMDRLGPVDMHALQVVLGAAGMQS